MNILHTDIRYFIQTVGADRTLSTIALMQSSDGGLSWVTVKADLIPPELDTSLSWKHAYVYGFDTVPGERRGISSIVYINQHYNRS